MSDDDRYLRIGPFSRAPWLGQLTDAVAIRLRQIEVPAAAHHGA